MPELPDVEGYRRMLEHAEGHRITRIEVPDASVLHDIGAAVLGRALHSRRFRHPRRHGKWLFGHTDGPTLVFHFGMTGELLWDTEGDNRHPHDRVVVVTDHGELRYRDQRKLHGIWLAADDDEIDLITGDQGPDALGLSRNDLRRVLKGRRGGIKSALMDQSVVGGLGNLLTDEILWRARLHPATGVNQLGDDGVGRLHQAMRSVLRTSVREGRVPPRRSWLTGVRDQDSPACPRRRRH